MWLSGVKAFFKGTYRSGVLSRLAAIERKLDRPEHFSYGARANYVGNNRVLMKCVVADSQIAFLVEADDLLPSRWFIVSGGYETALTNFLLRALRADSRSIDVGTNFSYCTCLTRLGPPRWVSRLLRPSRYG